MIPKIIHYTWLTPPGGKEFNMHHMAAVKSAHFFNPDFTIKFHCDQVPTGKYFEEIKNILEINHVETPEEVFGIPIKHMVMKSDVLRLRLLIAEGGVYQDLDIITMRPYSGLLNNKVCLGFELSPKLTLRQCLFFLRTLNFEVIKYKFRVIAGLCAGFMMAEKDSVFLKDWYEEYRKFNNDKWAFFPVKLPYLMLKTGKYQVKTIDPYQAHFPSCAPEDLKMIFEQNLKIEGKYFLHVWETRSYEKYLKPLTKEVVLRSDNTYCNAIKQFV
jgi:Glycosyltransferase sugar-binding region containing DXD motif